MPDMVTVSRYVAQYRVPFHEALRTKLTTNDVGYRLLYGAPRPGEAARQDAAAIGWAEAIRATYLGPGGKLVWLSVLRRVRGADLVVITQENALLNNYALQLWRRFGGPKLAYFGHGKNFQSSRPDSAAERFKRLWIKQVDWWFAYTERSAAVVAGAGFPRDRITVVNNAIDTSRIAAEVAALDPAAQTALRQSLFHGAQNIGVYVGGLYPGKRLGFLLDAARLVREAVPDFQLLIMGAGPDAGIAEAAAAELPWVHYAGPRFGVEKTELVSLARVLLIPGVVGLGVLDSFAYGTPMVTTDVPGHGPEIEYLRHGENGLIVADDVRTYAKAVSELLTDEAWRLQLRRGGEAALHTFTIQAMAQRFADGVLGALTCGRQS
ncbi:glycosyltransferase family 4 protein [Pseudonocardia charpentierae]|uniref:Glycosyltransferase family 4 protein n=1 Tax=Pseudonocardia charpentierae TaxID=3075545 RepID=A0ABU2NIH9_9PSEU|nr:glycosyltransferase family 4 protein [Pseudonocardia sp. DSM 45834]MDT0353771.1 glycosyltransferase family 4 protein [Pseudonocardia sp. DSM 45834]